MDRRIAGIVAIVSLGGCWTAGNHARARHAAEFRCPERDVTVETVASGTVRAVGCGVQAIYVCRGRGGELTTQGDCFRNGEATPVGSSPVAPTAAAPQVAPPAPPQAAT